MKGIVFAAGLGTRLRPITDVIPKPLAPVGPWPLIRYAIETLKAAGIVEIGINLFHLPDVLPAAIGDGAAWGVKIHWSKEAPAILGTGGGLRAMRGFLGDEPFVVINGDTLIDVDLREAMAEHARTNAVATMVLKDDPRVSTFGAIGYDMSGRVWDFVGRVPVPTKAGPLSKALFTGVHVFSPKIFDFIAATGEVNLGTETYPALLRAGARISSVLQTGTWSDLGTAERLLEANLEVVSRNWTFSRFDPLRGYAEGPPGVFLGSGAVREAGIRLARPVFIGANTTIRKDSTVGPGVVLGANVTVNAGVSISHALVFDGTTVYSDVRSAIATPTLLVPVK